MPERGVANVKRLQNIFRGIENNPDFNNGKIHCFVTPNPDAPVYPDGFEKHAPYTLALVEFPNGRMLMAQLTDIEVGEAFIGMELERVTRKLSETNDGIIVYGIKFRPALDGE